jgi:hypothetical protein
MGQMVGGRGEGSKNHHALYQRMLGLMSIHSPSRGGGLGYVSRGYEGMKEGEGITG